MQQNSPPPSENNTLPMEIDHSNHPNETQSLDTLLGATKALDAKEIELDKKRLEKTLKNTKRKLDRGSFASSNLEDRLGELNDDLAIAEKDQQEISERIRARKIGAPLPIQSEPSALGKKDEESQREYLIRTGKITPFAAISGLEKSKQNTPSESLSAFTGDASKSHIHLTRPSWSLVEKNVKKEDQPSTSKLVSVPAERSSMRKARTKIASGIDYDDQQSSDYDDTNGSDSDFVNSEANGDDLNMGDDEDYTDLKEILSGGDDDDDFKPEIGSDSVSGRRPRGGAAYKSLCEDDGDEMHYQRRLADWAQKRRNLRWKIEHPDGSTHLDLTSGSEQNIDLSIEMTTPHPTIPDAELDGGYRIPGDIYSNLFDYQKTCTQWLWELHCQGAGGIIGDEMGLGKTIQIIAFLAGLQYSGKLDAPVIIVCPATLLKQWVKEFHRWWPPMRVAILHSSGSGMHSKLDPDRDIDEDDSFSDGYGSGSARKKRKSKKRFGGGLRRGKQSDVVERTVADDIVDRISSKGHVIVTTYAGLRIHSSRLLRKTWSYIVLDEGHKIRNPDADITLVCKQFRTPHRIILSGTPIQNNLNELWSLFDFVFPGRLGTLPVFQSQFAIPINLGGYANASNIQVQTAYKCACVLRDLINPYLLRRMKADVASDMPKKSEQVLFCKLTPPQRAAYEDFLKSNELTSIMEGKRHALYGIDIVRKICNHADILKREHHSNDLDYGHFSKSGKMVVVKALLQMWKTEKHRVLLFSQTRTMLDILEKFIKGEGYEYRRMDGTTPIQNRMGLVDEFNARDDIYVFLLTTKVGGLGVNLTGADRVIIFDPDWNPSTDVQARERAWRLGQTKEVTIYRLMTSGTIEEKIYHRQIFKQFLTNKILNDPKQRRFFKSHDMADLFKLEGEDAVGTETGGIFHGSEISMKSKTKTSGKGKKKTTKRGGDNLEELSRLDGVRKVEKFNMPRESSSLPGGVKAEEDEEIVFKSSKTEETSQDNPEINILASLFKSSGVHSAVKHDEIMDSAKQENLIIEREATRVAERAMAALKESRKRRRRQDLDVPTWTGKSGSAGAPKAFLLQQQDSGPTSQATSSSSKPRFGTTNIFNSSATSSVAPRFGKSETAENRMGGRSQPGFGSVSSTGVASSSSLLAGMLERKRLEQEGGFESRSRTSTGSPSSSRNSPSSSPCVDSTSVLQEGTQESLITKIRDYMMDQGGRVRSADLVEHFQYQLADMEQLVFKKMLKGIAVLEKSESEGQGWWKLKSEYYY
ncbi:hypothetical protein BGZ76_001718 [Entomortierella beljakovae]|nr:hypothetical protein BGZ76_001718 [Entomortierella beljakovae]